MTGESVSRANGALFKAQTRLRRAIKEMGEAQEQVEVATAHLQVALNPKRRQTAVLQNIQRNRMSGGRL